MYGLDTVTLTKVRRRARLMEMVMSLHMLNLRRLWVIKVEMSSR